MAAFLNPGSTLKVAYARIDQGLVAVDTAVSNKNIGVVTNGSTGVYGVFFASGLFTLPPVVTITLENAPLSGGTNPNNVFLDQSGNTTVRCIVSIANDAGTGQSGSFYIFAIGV